MKRFLILMAIVCLAAGAAVAQSADVSLVAGGSFVSDTQSTFITGISAASKLKTDNHLFIEGTLGLKLINAGAASLSFEVPVAGIPSTAITLSTSPSTVVNHLSTVFVTPSLRLKILPASPIAPWVSFGGGWARYSLDSGNTNKGAVQYGGGIDFKLLPVVGLRAEVRDYVTGEPNFGLVSVLNGNNGGFHHHNVLVGGGVVLRF
jgi:opacity protein-like surface antigen